MKMLNHQNYKGGISMKQFRRMAGLVMVASVALLATNCSVYMAAKQPGKKDLSVLKEGTERGHVIAELGSPIHTEERPDGRMDIYKFVQGYHGGVKAGRALFHGTADVFTLGLWEVIGTPVEALYDGTEVKVEVYYDSSDKVRSVNTISGGEVIASPQEDTNKSPKMKGE